ncbi:MAG: hypothetical protein WCA91_22035, partial [Candidatus Acidiferrales bacterium]
MKPRQTLLSCDATEGTPRPTRFRLELLILESEINSMNSINKTSSLFITAAAFVALTFAVAGCSK